MKPRITHSPDMPHCYENGERVCLCGYKGSEIKKKHGENPWNPWEEWEYGLISILGRNFAPNGDGSNFAEGEYEIVELTRSLVAKEKRDLLEKLLEKGHGGGNWRRLITHLMPSE